MGSSTTLQGQALGTSLRSLSLDSVLPEPREMSRRYFASTSGPGHSDSLRTRSHTGTGLLIGGLVGGVATAVFLAGFCSDADTECGADEVGRAVLFIAVPTALVGTLIGSLIRTKEP